MNSVIKNHPIRSILPEFMTYISDSFRKKQRFTTWKLSHSNWV
jgi:hypothetical protein